MSGEPRTQQGAESQAAEASSVFHECTGDGWSRLFISAGLVGL